MAPAVYDQTTVEIEAGGVRAPCDRHGAEVRRLHEDLRGGRRTRIATEQDERKKHLPPVDGRSEDGLREASRRAAFDRAAAALHGSVAGEDARREGRGPAEHLCDHRRHDPAQLHQARAAPLRAARDGLHRQRDARRIFLGHRERRVHLRDGTPARPGRGEARQLGLAARRLLRAVRQPIWRAPRSISRRSRSKRKRSTTSARRAGVR